MAGELRGPLFPGSAGFLRIAIPVGSDSGAAGLR